MNDPIIVPASVSDFQRLAQRHLPRFVYDFIVGGAGDEVTLRRNIDDFHNVILRQTVLKDVSNLSPATTLLGEKLAMPLALAPVGMTGLFARRGELQAKRAADAAGIPFTLSTMSICSVEEVAQVSKKPFWFQLYMLRDRGLIRNMLERAQNVGVRNLVFTVDGAAYSRRRRDVRNGIAGGASAIGRFRAVPLTVLQKPRWLYQVGLKGRPHSFGNIAPYISGKADLEATQQWTLQQLDSSVTWDDIDWLRQIWDGNLIIKGLMTPEDGQAAADVGAEAVVVSNHGGRQLDGAASSISMLQSVVDAVQGRTEVLMDSGVRSGLDIAKALSFGAAGVLIGRPYVLALSGGGEQGLASLLASFQSELAIGMALCGVNRIEDLTRDCVQNFPADWMPCRSN